MTTGLSNTIPLPEKIYSGEGIAQLVFFEAGEALHVFLEDRRSQVSIKKGIRAGEECG